MAGSARKVDAVNPDQTHARKSQWKPHDAVWAQHHRYPANNLTITRDPISIVCAHATLGSREATLRFSAVQTKGTTPDGTMGCSAQPTIVCPSMLIPIAAL